MTAQVQQDQNAKLDLVTKMIGGYDAVIPPMLNELKASVDRSKALAAEFYGSTQDALRAVSPDQLHSKGASPFLAQAKAESSSKEADGYSIK